MQNRRPLRIEVPREETLRLGRVGVYAVLGFGVGILLPHLAGLRLVPSVPTEKSEANAAELSGAPAAPRAASAAQATAAPPVEPAPAPPRDLFTVSPGEITSCRGANGKKRETCDPVDFDAIARGRLATLSACDAAERAEGLLSVGFELDFGKDRLVGVTSGKSTSLPQDDVDALLGCLKGNLGEVSLAGIRHEHERYSVFYKVVFTGSGEKKKPADVPDVEVTPATGKATVAWDAALVRSGPTRDGDVVARVLQGTRVQVTGRHGDWYRIKYDAKGGEGWVFRTAIGM